MQNVFDFLSELDQQYISPLAELHKLEDDLRDAIKLSSKAAEEFNRSLFEHARQFEIANDKLASIIRSPNWENFSSSLVDLSSYGWYINYRFDMIQIGTVRKLLKRGEIAEVDQLMKDWVVEDLNTIKNSVLVDHPERKIPLEQAFYAHEAGLYALSIPVFFAQIDGICSELTGYNFFLNKNRVHVPKVREWVLSGNKTGIYKALCAALLDKGAFQLHRDQQNKIGFTRHSVLHGETNNYGTEINSIKAISLLAYISDVCSRS